MTDGRAPATGAVNWAAGFVIGAIVLATVWVTGAIVEPSVWVTAPVIGVIVEPSVWVTGVIVVESAPVTGAMTWVTGLLSGVIAEPSVCVTVVGAAVLLLVLAAVLVTGLVGAGTEEIGPVELKRGDELSAEALAVKTVPAPSARTLTTVATRSLNSVGIPVRDWRRTPRS